VVRYEVPDHFRFVIESISTDSGDFGEQKETLKHKDYFMPFTRTAPVSTLLQSNKKLMIEETFKTFVQ